MNKSKKTKSPNTVMYISQVLPVLYEPHDMGKSTILSEGQVGIVTMLFNNLNNPPIQIECSTRLVRLVRVYCTKVWVGSTFWQVLSKPRGLYVATSLLCATLIVLQLVIGLLAIVGCDEGSCVDK